MKVTYDPNRDDLRILLSDAPIERSSADTPGLIVDFDNNGVVVGLEVSLASQRMPDPRHVEFSVGSTTDGLPGASWSNDDQQIAPAAPSTLKAR